MRTNRGPLRVGGAREQYKKHTTDVSYFAHLPYGFFSET